VYIESRAARIRESKGDYLDDLCASEETCGGKRKVNSKNWKDTSINRTRGAARGTPW